MSQEPEESQSPTVPFSMSIRPDSKQSISRQIEALVEPRDNSPSAYSAAELESRLEEEKSQRKKERFFWIFAVVLLADCILFKFLDSAAPSIFLSLLSVVMLIGCANWLEVAIVHAYLDRVFARFLPRKGAEAVSDQREEN
jgi:hypothetical protein